MFTYLASWYKCPSIFCVYWTSNTWNTVLLKIHFASKRRILNFGLLFTLKIAIKILPLIVSYFAKWRIPETTRRGKCFVHFLDASHALIASVQKWILHFLDSGCPPTPCQFVLGKTTDHIMWPRRAASASFLRTSYTNGRFQLFPWSSRYSIVSRCEKIVLFIFAYVSVKWNPQSLIWCVDGSLQGNWRPLSRCKRAKQSIASILLKGKVLSVWELNLNICPCQCSQAISFARKSFQQMKFMISNCEN